jgi:hypothetical protein
MIGINTKSHVVGVSRDRDTTRYWYCMNYNLVTLKHEHTRGMMGVSHESQGRGIPQ